VVQCFHQLKESIQGSFPEVYERLELATNLISDAALFQILNNPRVSFVLNYFGRAEVHKSVHTLDQMFTIELARITGVCRTTAHTKAYSVDGCSIVTLNGEVNTLDLFRSHTGMAIDFFSNYVMTYKSHSAQNRCMPYEEAAQVFEDLEDTLKLMAGSPYLDFVRLCTEVIGIRKLNFDPNQHFFASESLSKYVKQTIIYTNKPQNGAVLFMEALVHEAVHSFVDMIGVIDDHESEFTAHTNLTKFKSPWTSNPVNLTNLDQAICVWYCLYYFWHWTLDHLPQFSKQAGERINYIFNGFSNLDVDQLLMAGKKELPEAVLETLSEMKYEVARHGN